MSGGEAKPPNYLVAERLYPYSVHRDQVPYAIAERAILKNELLTTALQGLMPESPWDIDQNCRYCNSHYEGHDDDCPWAVASDLLEGTTS